MPAKRPAVSGHQPAKVGDSSSRPQGPVAPYGGAAADALSGTRQAFPGGILTGSHTGLGLITGIRRLFREERRGKERAQPRPRPPYHQEQALHERAT